MKIIHTSDLHIASALTTRLTPLKRKERALEIIGGFRRITEDAKEIGAEAIIISGDLFDSESVSIGTIDTVMGIIESSSNISFLYLPGNHEKDRLISSGARLPKNLRIFAEDWTYFDLGELTVIGRTATARNMFDSIKLDKERINILAMHGELADHSGEGGKIGVDALSELPIDYVALGHYHSFSEKRISNRTTAVYCGTPEGRGFDEAGDKGYVLITADEGGVSYKFTKSAKRTLHIVEVDITGCKRELDIEERIAEAVNAISHNDLVRVVLVGEHESGLRRDTDAFTLRFGPSYYFFEIKDKSRLQISADEYKNDKSLKGEFIRLVLSKDDITDEQKDAIIECGLRALAGETI